MSGGRTAEHTPDGRWIVVEGRRWRATDPELPEDLRRDLQSALGRARSAVRTADDADRPAVRRRVQLAKEGLGERGEPWWELEPDARIDRARRRLAAIAAVEDGRGEP